MWLAFNSFGDSTSSSPLRRRRASWLSIPSGILPRGLRAPASPPAPSFNSFGDSTAREDGGEGQAPPALSIPSGILPYELRKLKDPHLMIFQFLRGFYLVEEEVWKRAPKPGFQFLRGFYLAEGLPATRTRHAFNSFGDSTCAGTPPAVRGTCPPFNSFGDSTGVGKHAG